MTVTHIEIRPGAYYDSVVLMQLQRALAGLPGVEDAGVVMATPANRDLLVDGDLLPVEANKAGPDDLLIVVRAESDSAAAEALTQVDNLLARRRSAVTQEFRPRSLSAAAKQLPNAGWVLISVPGRYAAGVARDALSLNCHVFLYSDNVALEDEVALKQTAQEKGLLLMGPDCGTAMINGVGLGFANRVRRGAIGLVGASGTGLQAVMTHIHNLGAGVSHAIGTGGRDLHADVGASTALQGLELLGRDPETQVIVLVSKPPAPDVAARLLAAAQICGKPVVVDFIGYPPPARQLGNLHFAVSLSEAAQLAVDLVIGNQQLVIESSSNYQLQITNIKYLRGLFSGGTLAYEATLGLQATLYPLYSNIPVHAGQRLPNGHTSQAHTILDLGADEFTVGRLHPMLDNDLRIRRMRQEAADPEVGVILLDVVLGEGAHPDPAGELAPVIAECLQEASDRLEVVAIVMGTDEDPQNTAQQAETLRAAGARVFDNTTAAIAYISSSLSTSEPPAKPVDLEPLQAPLAAINVGLESFYESLTAQDASAVHVDWRPPAGGNEKLMDILARMKKK